MLDDEVAAIDDIGVVAETADERVCGAVLRAVEPVVAGVAGPGGRERAGKDEVLDVLPERVAFARDDRVDAFTGVLEEHVSRAQNVGVVSEAAGEHVRRRALRAVEPIAERVSGARQRSRADKGEVLDSVTQRIAHLADDRVGGRSARVFGLDYHVTQIVDVVGVVPRSTVHVVGALAAVQDVVCRVPIEAIVERVTVGMDRSRLVVREELQILEVFAERVIEQALDRVDALAGKLDDRVLVHARGADVGVDILPRLEETVVAEHVGVVAGATDQRVGGPLTEQRVVSVEADQRVRELVPGKIVVRRIPRRIDCRAAGQ